VGGLLPVVAAHCDLLAVLDARGGHRVALWQSATDVFGRRPPELEVPIETPESPQFLLGMADWFDDA
jgi:hypothetical protein